MTELFLLQASSQVVPEDDAEHGEKGFLIAFFFFFVIVFTSEEFKVHFL